MPGQPASPSLVFASGGATSSASGICSVPSHSLVLHASGPSVVVVDTSSRLSRISAVLPTYPGARVAGVAAAAGPDAQSPVVCAAALSDGSLAVTARRDGIWSAPAIVVASGGGGRNATPLVSVCGLYCALEDRYYIVTAAMDDARGAGLCVVWTVEGVKSDSALQVASLAKTSKTPDHFLPECIAATLATGKLLVALGGTDRIVHLYELDGPSLAHLPAVLKGHRDWVRGLSFSQSLETELGSCFLLATGSTDTTVRVWKFALVDESVPERAGGGIDSLALGEEGNRARVVFRVAGRVWSATHEALLTEHQGPVLSVSFSRDPRKPALLTASMDGSVGLWSLSSGVSDQASRWVPAARFGLLGGTAAIALGFSGAVFANPGVDRILAHTLVGSIFSWRRDAPSVENESRGVSLDDDGGRFVAECAPGGHVGPVNSVAWDPKGRYLLSCGEDKTSRVYVPFPGSSNQFVEWARPQVHGHPVRGVDFLSLDGRSFVSISEEKVLRLFDAPAQFCTPSAERNAKGSADTMESSSFSMRAISAAVPELGLSNKAVFEESSESAARAGETTADAAGSIDGSNEDGDEGGPVTPFDISGGADAEMTSFGAERASDSAPLEVELRQHRLWPERAKLYGHGNDVSCVAVDLNYGIMASASRAQGERDAAIILWEIETGVEKARLVAHDLTVNQLQFSPDGTALLSVSRDRSFAIFRNASPRHDPFAFSRVAREIESHGRLLHAGCWMHDTDIVVTGSRDKCLKAWKCAGPEARREAVQEAWEVVEVYKQKFSSGVSALEATCAADSNDSRNLLAFGLEDGCIAVARLAYDSTAGKVTFSIVLNVPASLQCCGRVTRLAWRPKVNRDANGASNDANLDGGRHLAAGSDDHSVRIYHLEIR